MPELKETSAACKAAGPPKGDGGLDITPVWEKRLWGTPG